MKHLFFNRLDAHQPLTSSRLSYAKVDSIGQTFKSDYDNLNIVSICIRNQSRVLTPFEFSLYEATSSSKPIRTLSFSGGNIDNQDCTRFQFDPVDDSKGKVYLATISAKPVGEGREYYSVYIEAHQGGDYREGQAYLGTTPTDQDLHFKTFYRQDLQTVMSESSSQLGGRLISDPLFMIPYLIIIIYVIRRLIKK